MQEYERKVMPWLWTFAIFTVWRALALIFFAIVNDLYFAYNILMVLLWSIFCLVSIYGWAVVYSLFLELVDLTKLEDLAHLRVSLVIVQIAKEPLFTFILSDGHYGFTARIHSQLAGWLPSDNTPQHCVYNASGLVWWVFQSHAKLNNPVHWNPSQPRLG